MTNAKGIDRPTLAFAAALVGLTAFRIVFLRLDLIDLYFDEAQYWAWSRTLELGYFTKPPLVAWVIAGTTALFGDAEWAVRLAAPLAHGVAALALFLLGRATYGAWAGLWAGLTWLLIPGVSLSANVISTDALLLPLWSAALYAFWKLTATRTWTWAIVLGVAVGLGVQAKYAMLYFPLCVALAAYWLKPARAGLAQGRGVVAALIALAVIAPNFYWNVQHGFVTAQHTAANARFDAPNLFSLSELFEFLLGQANVIGPLLFVAFVGMLWRAGAEGSSLRDEDKFLIAFILPPLLFVSAIAFISRANANWAAVIYPAACVWIAGWLSRGVNGRRFLFVATVLNLALFCIAVTLFLKSPAVANRFDGIREARNWEETARKIAQRALGEPGDPEFTAVMVDDRTAFFELGYYWRELRRSGTPLPPVRMWLLYDQPRNSAELSDPMRPSESERVLVVHMTPSYTQFVSEDFRNFTPTFERLSVPLGGGVSRDLEFSIGERFEPAQRDEEFFRRLHAR